jgi:hypothetical protein
MPIFKLVTRVVLTALGVVVALVFCWAQAAPNDSTLSTIMFLMAIPYHVVLVILRLDSIHSNRVGAMILTVITIEVGIFAALRTLARDDKSDKRKMRSHLNT